MKYSQSYQYAHMEEILTERRQIRERCAEYLVPLLLAKLKMNQIKLKLKESKLSLGAAASFKVLIALARGKIAQSEMEQQPA
jgi:hypothetical protein